MEPLKEIRDGKNEMKLDAKEDEDQISVERVEEMMRLALSCN